MSKRILYPDQFKQFDTPERQERERGFIQRYAEATRATGYVQQGIGARYDAKILGAKGAVRELIEVKDRKLVRARIEFLNIDMKKVDTLRAISVHTRAPVYLVVHWQDDELTRVNLSNAIPRTWAVQEYTSKLRQEFPDLQYLIPVQEFEKI